MVRDASGFPYLAPVSKPPAEETSGEQTGQSLPHGFASLCHCTGLSFYLCTMLKLYADDAVVSCVRHSLLCLLMAQSVCSCMQKSSAHCLVMGAL